MSTLIQTKTNFTAGELSPRLLGRGDLRAYDNGAARLRNVFIQPTGGVSRRAGLRHLDGLPGGGRLIGFEFNAEQVYLLALTDGLCTVFMEEAPVAAFAAPWTAAHLPTLAWTQSADTLLVVHPDLPPCRVTRTSHTDWSVGAWTFTAIPEVVLDVRLGTWTGVTDRVWAEVPFFTAAHVGRRFRVGTQAITVTAVISGQTAACEIDGYAPTDAYRTAYGEAFNDTDGYPAAVTFHQDRLVFGGSRARPNHLWFSAIGDYGAFGGGQGLDDDPIDFPLMSDQVNSIRHLFSGRDLQVFTAGAEWTVRGDPLTAATVQARRQTRVGSAADRGVPPRDVDGATLFCAASGHELREFLYSDSENAYQATDLALLARHLFATPVDMDYDPVRRLVHVVMADGTMATVTNFRREQVTAWTRQETDGALRAVAVAGGETYVLTERGGAWAVEVFDDAAATDACLSGTVAAPTVAWGGLGHLEGRSVRLVADGVDVGTAVVTGGAVTLAVPAASLEAGLPFRHLVEPLPPLPDGPRGGGNGRQVRLVRASFRLLETPVLSVDTGRGPTVLTFKRFSAGGVLDTPPPPFTGDATVRALGWQRDAVRPLWTVAQDTPLPCTILSVTTETKVTD